MNESLLGCFNEKQISVLHPDVEDGTRGEMGLQKRSKFWNATGQGSQHLEFSFVTPLKS